MKLYRTVDGKLIRGVEIESGCYGKSKKKGKKSVKSAFNSEDFFEIYPYDDNADPHSDEDLGLSAVIEVYGDEFVNVDDNTLSGMRDTLERYFDDEAYVRDWNIENSADQIESIEDVSSVEDLSVDDLAMYFDYEAYGRDIRIGDGYRWDDEKNCWTTNPDVIGQSKKSVKNGVSSSRRKSLTSSADLYDFTFEDENGFDRHAFYAEENDGSFEVTDTDPQYKEVRIGDVITVADAEDMGLEYKEVLASSSHRIRSNRRRINSDYSDAFDEGYEAYFDDADPYGDNPYEYKSDDWYAWKKGYDKAAAQDEFEMDELY